MRRIGNFTAFLAQTMFSVTGTDANSSTTELHLAAWNSS
jgi:hypothetical protein